MAGAQDSNLEDDGQDDLDVKAEANDKSSTSLEKKPKTPEQIERERMRRRRRRQRQRIMRSLETNPEAEKKEQVQKPKPLEDKQNQEQKLIELKAKQKLEKERAEAGRKDREKKQQDEKNKVDKQKARDEVPSRDQQLRDESHPRVLDANVPPDMSFEKPALDDQEGLKKKQEEEKITEDLKKKEKEEKLQKERAAAELKKKLEKEEKERQQKEKEEAEKEKVELEEKAKQSEEEIAQLEKTVAEEKSQEEVKSEPPVVKEDPLELDEPEEPTTVYHPEPAYTTNSFAFEEPKEDQPKEDQPKEDQEKEELQKVEKPLSPGIQAEPDVVPAKNDQGESDLELISELMDKNSEPEADVKPEAEEELIAVSEPVVEQSDDEQEQATEELDLGEPVGDEKVEDPDLLDNPDEDTLVSADSVVDEIPIFPPKEVEVLPADSSDDELTFGDSEDEGPSIPVGKMREDHAGSSPDLVLPYDGGPVVEREVTPVEGPNLLSENVEPESKEATEDTAETVEKKEKTNVAEELNEKKAPAATFAANLAKMVAEVSKKIVPAVGGFFGNIGKFLKGIFGKLNIKMVGGVVAVLVVIGLGYFGFTQKWHEQAWGAVSGTVGSFFKPKIEEPKVEVKPDVNDQRAFGITTGLLFAQNMGSVSDRLTADISVALYYGGLQEPKVQGETGISAATFYGELRDEADFVNVYVEYVETLEHMQSLYKTDVYKLLDQTTKRDVVLLKHLDELTAMKEKGLRIQEQIGINLDDLKVSYESLNGEKNKGETDFFAALSDLQGQKSDTLLKQFIEVSQKQIALKARIAALTKLQAYYVTALARLDKRFEAIDKNRDPLIQGIRVVDVPGSDLDLIIREQ